MPACCRPPPLCLPHALPQMNEAQWDFAVNWMHHVKKARGPGRRGHQHCRLCTLGSGSTTLLHSPQPAPTNLRNGWPIVCAPNIPTVPQAGIDYYVAAATDAPASHRLAELGEPCFEQIDEETQKLGEPDAGPGLAAGDG